MKYLNIAEALRIGGRSVRVHLVPMAVLWALAGALVAGYYFVPCVAAALDPLYRWQTSHGWVAAFLTRFVFCGALPGVFLLTMKRLAVPHPLWVVAAQTVWSGVCGVLSGWMYSLNAAWFGTGIDLTTLAVKTAACQFVWTPFVFMPLGTLVYFWIGRDFSFGRCRREWERDFWTRTFCPNLLVNWAIWLPGSMLLHLFPTPLQIQLSGFANTYFALVLLWIGRGGR